MNELLNFLKSKYNYDDELLSFLRSLIPIMIEYFGEEYRDKIISSFLETPIIITKNTIGKEIGDDNSGLLLAGGAFCPEVAVEDNSPKILGKVVIPTSAIKLFNFNDPKCVGNLVHELCHMVKSNLTINVDENILVYYCGLSQTKGIIDNNEFSVQSSNNALALEEAINAIDETIITQKLFPEYQLTSNYGRLASYIWPMINENTEFLGKMRQSQFTGSSDWTEYLGIETSEKLIQLCSAHYDLMVNRIFELINNKNLQLELDNIEKELINIINLSKEISTKRTL